ncbi:MAG: DUF6655 family protein [Planctomycetota bacterium]
MTGNRFSQIRKRLLQLAIVFCCLMVSGCGTMKSRKATDQLLVSDAVDRSINRIDFRPLAGSDVYLDTTYLKHLGNIGFVNSAYLISALREQMIRQRCVIHENRNDAKYVVEVRVGALGTDGHEINYGMPASGALNSTAALFSNAPILPAIPEISLAKRDERRAAVKIGVFAYNRESKEPVWHPGMVKGQSLAKSTWILGAGPFQQGTIYDEAQFAGSPIGLAPEQGSQSALVQFGNQTREGLKALFMPRSKSPAPQVVGHPTQYSPSAYPQTYQPGYSTSPNGPTEWRPVEQGPSTQPTLTDDEPKKGGQAKRVPRPSEWPEFRVSDR